MSMTEPSPVADAEADAPAPYTGPTRAIPFYFHIPAHSSSDPTTAPAAASPTQPQRLTHTHQVPTPLLTPTPSNVDADLFVATLSDALGAHRDECFGAAGAECEICSEAKGDVLLTPVSFLHVPDSGAVEEGKAGEGKGEGDGDGVEGKDVGKSGEEKNMGKRVDVIVTPVCGRETCEVLARQKVRRVVEGLQNAGQQTEEGQEEEGMELGIKEGPADPRCKTCGKTEGTRKCTGCGRVRYCGRECQKKDWKVHKRLCGGL